jgi:prohibitin 2
MPRHPEYGEMFDPMRRQFRSAGVIIAVIIVVLVLLFTTFHIVPPGHRGVAVTLGNVSPQFRNEGLRFKLPITRVRDVPIRQQTVGGKTDVFSSDLQNVSVEYNVLYRIPERHVVALFQQYAGDPYQSLVDPRLQETLKQLTATYRAEDLVKNREKLKDETLVKIRQVIQDMVDINDLTITNMMLSKQLEQAIEQKVIREQEALAKKFELDKANKDAEITIVEAKAQAEAVQIKGEALKVAPEVIDFEIAQKWDGKAPTTVVTSSGGSNVLLPIR